MKVKVDNLNEISFDSDSSLLECLERHNIEISYHCRDGFCGACRAVLKSGKVSYKVEPLAFIRDGEFLTCCSMPVTDIEIELD